MNYLYPDYFEKHSNCDTLMHVSCKYWKYDVKNVVCIVKRYAKTTYLLAITQLIH